MVDYASHQGCKTRRLLEYCGEPVEEDCGHCGWCRGYRPGPLVDNRSITIGEREMKLIDRLGQESTPALRLPRQMARFLCGLSSPSATRAKLNRHPLFGTLGYLSFQVVLEYAAAKR